MNSNHPKIAILGKGYLGTKIGEFLEKNGFEIELISSKEIDYHNRKIFWRYLVNSEPDIVINCSGFTGRPNIDQAEDKKLECLDLNVTSPLQIAELCNSIGIKHIHLGSGCIYDGYSKNFTEMDFPNFGVGSDSSFYSKTKHLLEILSAKYPSKIIRIRMPISGLDSQRCYLSKIQGYDNLIDLVNSKTYIPDLCEFILNLVTSQIVNWDEFETFNVVNSDPLSTKEVCELMFLAKKHNPNWDFIPLSELKTKAPRSNCILDGSKADNLYKMKTEFDILVECLHLEHLNLTRSQLQ